MALLYCCLDSTVSTLAGAAPSSSRHHAFSASSCARAAASSAALRVVGRGMGRGRGRCWRAGEGQERVAGGARGEQRAAAPDDVEARAIGVWVACALGAPAAAVSRRWHDVRALGRGGRRSLSFLGRRARGQSRRHQAPPCYARLPGRLPGRGQGATCHQGRHWLEVASQPQPGVGVSSWLRVGSVEERGARAQKCRRADTQRKSADRLGSELDQSRDSRAPRIWPPQVSPHASATAALICSATGIVSGWSAARWRPSNMLEPLAAAPPPWPCWSSAPCPWRPPGSM